MMILQDGPAEGAYMVGRAPFHLRAVVDEKTGKKDVLDQLGDYPQSAERVYVYRCVKNDGGMALVRLSGRNGKGAHCVPSVMAEYEYLPDVDGEALRETAAWQEWAVQQARPSDIDPRTSAPVSNHV